MPGFPARAAAADDLKGEHRLIGAADGGEEPSGLGTSQPQS